LELEDGPVVDLVTYKVVCFENGRCEQQLLSLLINFSVKSDADLSLPTSEKQQQQIDKDLS
jgi:hypothetical protein